jgi:nucleoid-associated protein YgaU
MSSLNCRYGINVSYREKSLKVLSSIWFWMGVIGLSVVSYGVFDAVNKQQQVSDIPVATESGQEDPPIEKSNPSSIEENTEQAEPASEEDPEVVQVEFSLDTARVDADGLVTLAGRAAKGATVEVLVDENLIGTIAVGQDGNFASIFELNSSEEIRVLVLRIKTGEQFAYADQSIVILPSQIKGNAVENDLQVSEGDAGLESSVGAPSVETSDVDNSTVSQEQKTAKTEESFNLESKEALVENQKDVEQAELVINIDESADPNLSNSDDDKSDKTANVALDSDGEITPSKPKVVVADSDGVKVLQDEQAITDQLALDSIAYDPFGNVTVGGRSSPSGLVRFYVNNEAISAAKTNKEGYWETDLSDIVPGTYTLRIDQLSLKGDVISRLESPFKREDREKLAKLIAPSTSPARINIITVQPGNTLWAIARKRYGDGLLYVRVFEANRDKIKDPDLIYPGQLFDLPDLN